MMERYRPEAFATFRVVYNSYTAFSRTGKRLDQTDRAGVASHGQASGKIYLSVQANRFSAV